MIMINSFIFAVPFTFTEGGVKAVTYSDTNIHKVREKNHTMVVAFSSKFFMCLEL